MCNEWYHWNSVFKENKFSRNLARSAAIYLCYLKEWLNNTVQIQYKRRTLTSSKREARVCKLWCFESVISRRKTNHYLKHFQLQTPSREKIKSRKFPATEKLFCCYNVVIRNSIILFFFSTFICTCINHKSVTLISLLYFTCHWIT